MNRIKIVLLNWAKKQFKWVFFVFPFLVLFYMGFYFTMLLFGKGSIDHYKILFGAIGMTATLGGLSLRLASTTKDANKAGEFYENGERLFHATLLFSVATVMNFAYGTVATFFSYLYVQIAAKVVLTIGGFIFFWYGLAFLVISLARLHNLLFVGHEKPLD